MADFKIFTEGGSDVVFIRDYVEDVFGIKLPINCFDTLGSWSGYKQGGRISPSILQSMLNDEKIILILDADVDFEARLIEVKNDFKQYNIPFELFLFPNNQEKGNREDLLTIIATDRKLIDCFTSYELCVKDYNLPLEKSRIFAYLDALLPANMKKGNTDRRKDENRDYKITAHWNLHHVYLQPFHQFLSPLFIQNKIQ